MDDIEELKRENRRLQIYRKLAHELCGYRLRDVEYYVMVVKQVVDWYEELSDEDMEIKLRDDVRLTKKSTWY